MKIFKISHDNKSHDFFLGHVIVANDKNEVIELAQHICADEGMEIWEYSEIDIIGAYTGYEDEPFILLSDFNAG